jgi:GntR family transcriptional regulator
MLERGEVIVMSSTGLAGSETVAEPSFYQRIMDDIRDKIASGEWPAGKQLPPTDELVTYYAARLRKSNLSRNTVRKAVEKLTDRGELRGLQGVGVFVPGGEING